MKKISTEQLVLLQATSFVAGLGIRALLVRKGSVKSFWWGLPRKVGTFRK